MQKLVCSAIVRVIPFDDHYVMHSETKLFVA